MPPVSLVAWHVGIGCAPMIVQGLLIKRPHFGALHTDCGSGAESALNRHF
jgi:hypothetical protein